MSQVVDRFLRYIAMDTHSEPDAGNPSGMARQQAFADLLAAELTALGATNLYRGEPGYLFATIPASPGLERLPVVGLIAHLDTSPSVSGGPVRPQIIRQYNGEDILLNKELHLCLSPREFPDLNRYLAQDIIVTDGTTLLGADDKAGVAEIMSMAQILLEHPELPHGPLRIGFTPDEEVGRGTDRFDLATFGADFAYTVDGGELGAIEYENFHAAQASVAVRGINIHPGTAKDRMRNALAILMQFHQLLPAWQSPEHTEGYEGFYHLESMQGEVEFATASYLVRDHDRSQFEAKKQHLLEIAAFLNKSCGSDAVSVQLTDQYFNMKEKILEHPQLIEYAKTAMQDVGVTPVVKPIRGGTDGARLSYAGLPCPNLCTGGHNFHSRFEFIPIQSMERIVSFLLRLASLFAR